MSVTMKDLAKYTGLSLGTISNYINGKVPVSKEKGERIEKAIKELGYTVNIAARSLKTNSFYCIGILIPSFSNQFLLNVIKYIELLLMEKGYNMLVLSYNDDMKHLYHKLGYLMQRTDAILCVPKYDMDSNIIEQMKKVPIITFDEGIDGGICDTILVNNAQIVEEAIDRIIDKGHTHIGFITGRKSAYSTLQRKKGYENALNKHKLPVREQYIAYGDYKKTSGYECCQQLLQSHPEITDIFVVGYRMTLGVLAALKDLKMEDKVDVTGYDARDIADIVDTRLGYVYQPYREIARSLVELAMRRVGGDYTDFPKTVIIEAELKDR